MINYSSINSKKFHIHHYCNRRFKLRSRFSLVWCMHDGGCGGEPFPKSVSSHRLHLSAYPPSSYAPSGNIVLHVSSIHAFLSLRMTDHVSTSCMRCARVPLATMVLYRISMPHSTAAEEETCVRQELDRIPQ